MFVFKSTTFLASELVRGSSMRVMSRRLPRNAPRDSLVTKRVDVTLHSASFQPAPAPSSPCPLPSLSSPVFAALAYSTELGLNASTLAPLRSPIGRATSLHTTALGSAYRRAGIGNNILELKRASGGGRRGPRRVLQGPRPEARL